MFVAQTLQLLHDLLQPTLMAPTTQMLVFEVYGMEPISVNWFEGIHGYWFSAIGIYAY